MIHVLGERENKDFPPCVGYHTYMYVSIPREVCFYERHRGEGHRGESDGTQIY